MRHHILAAGAVATTLWAASAAFAQNAAAPAVEQNAAAPGVEQNATAPTRDTPAAGLAATVQPGDRISLAAFAEPDVAGTYFVTEDGNVILPKLGVMKVRDKTVGQLQDAIRRAYANFIHSPVEVELLRRISIQGEVNKPDIYLVDLTMTLRDVIAKAGGITGGGDPNKIFILRGSEAIRVGENGGGIFMPVELRSGDQIVVGSRSWLSRNSFAVTSLALGAAGIIISVINSFRGL